MRGVKSLVTETSQLDPEEGLDLIYSIPELREKLPKIEGGVEPLPEAILWISMVKYLQKRTHAVSSCY